MLFSFEYKNIAEKNERETEIKTADRERETDRETERETDRQTEIVACKFLFLPSRCQPNI